MSAGVLEVRPMTAQDAVAVHALGDRYMQRMQDRPLAVGADSLADTLTWPGRDPELDVPLVLLDGRIVASAAVWATAPYREIAATCLVEVDLAEPVASQVRQVIVDRLLVAAQHHDAVREPDPARSAALLVHERDTALAAVAEANGFRLDRQLLLMAVDLRETEVPEPTWPDGLRLRPPTEADAAVVGDLLRDAFSEHPGDNDYDDDQTAASMCEPSGRLDLSLLAEDAEGAVAVILANTQTDGGYVGVLGVRSRARGRGLGTSLLRHVFRAFAAEGEPVVRLHVEQENTTGAVGVYEAAGMTRQRATQIWTRPLSS
jgi:mycothiol synthase